MERDVQIAADRRYLSIDITAPRTITWKITRDEWDYKGVCQVSLILDRVPSVPSAAYRKGSIVLKVRVSAYAIIYESSASGPIEKFRADRLIKNSNFSTDMPLVPDSRFWESWGTSDVELGLAGVQRYPSEDTLITIDVLTADPILAAAKPRLQIVGEHDYAVAHHLRLLRIIRDFALLCVMGCVIAIAWQALRRRSEKKGGQSGKSEGVS